MQSGDCTGRLATLHPPGLCFADDPAGAGHAAAVRRVLLSAIDHDVIHQFFRRAEFKHGMRCQLFRVKRGTRSFEDELPVAAEDTQVADSAADPVLNVVFEFERHLGFHEECHYV